MFLHRKIEQHARCIQRSNQMLNLLNSVLDILRKKHPNGEDYYWILYYTYICPRRLHNAHEIVDKLRDHIRDISYSTYFRRRQDAIDALSSILWGYLAKDSNSMLEYFFPDSDGKECKDVSKNVNTNVKIKYTNWEIYILHFLSFVIKKNRLERSHYACPMAALCCGSKQISLEKRAKATVNFRLLHDLFRKVMDFPVF